MMTILNLIPDLGKLRESEPSRTGSILLIGVGGWGCGQIHFIRNQGLPGIRHVACNTDREALDAVEAEEKILLGSTLLEGNGAGGDPFLGKQAAIESERQIFSVFRPETRIAIVVAGLGGGTGTGAAPEIIRMLYQINQDRPDSRKILVLAFMTLPLGMELGKRIQHAMDAIPLVRRYADSFIGICLEDLRLAYGFLPFDPAMDRIRDSLRQTILSLIRIINLVGVWNIDIMDIKAIMTGSGDAVIRTGQAGGADRAKKIFLQLAGQLNPGHQPFGGLQNLLIHFIYGKSQFSLDEMSDVVRQFQLFSPIPLENLQLGVAIDPKLGEQCQVNVIATGLPTRDYDLVYSQFSEKVESWIPRPEPKLDPKEKPAAHDLQTEKISGTSPAPGPSENPLFADSPGTTEAEPINSNPEPAISTPVSVPEVKPVDVPVLVQKRKRTGGFFSNLYLRCLELFDRINRVLDRAV